MWRPGRYGTTLRILLRTVPYVIAGRGRERAVLTLRIRLT